MEISDSDILKIAATEDDFGHEMRVGAAIRAIPGFVVQHGGTYTDPVTGKPRQFDYRCWLTKGATILGLAVECKNLNPSYPLVICGTFREDVEAFHDLIVSVGGGATVQRGADTVVGPRSMTYAAGSKQSFYRPGDFVGKSLLRLKPENSRSPAAVAGPDSDIYENCAQALSSVLELVALAFRPVAETIFSAVLPVVVVSDKSLWKLVYGHDDKTPPKAERVDQCEFYLGRRIRKKPDTFFVSHIHFFTISAFRSFLSNMAGYDGAWERLFEPGLLRFGPG